MNTVYCKKTKTFECTCRFNKLPSEPPGLWNSFSSKTNLHGTDFAHVQPHLCFLFICFLPFRRTATPAGKRLQQTDPAGWEMNTHTHTHSATPYYRGGGAFRKCSQSSLSSEHAVHSILINLAFGTLYICPLIPEKIMWSHVLQDSRKTNAYNNNSTNIK